MSFISVKYGASEEKLINTNVLLPILLTHIKTSCQLTTIPEPIDLATESGEVMDLYHLAKNSSTGSKDAFYAKRFLENRGVYVVVKVVGTPSDDEQVSYIPLLDSIGDKVKFTVTKRRKAPPAATKEDDSKKNNADELRRRKTAK